MEVGEETTNGPQPPWMTLSRTSSRSLQLYVKYFDKANSDIFSTVTHRSPHLRFVFLNDKWRVKRCIIIMIITVYGTSPTNHLCTVRQASECLATLPVTVFTQRNFVADFLRKNPLLYENRPFCVLTPFGGGGLEAAQDVQIGLIEKPISDN